MGEEFTERMMKVQKLIEMATVDEEIRSQLKSGDKDLVMPVLEQVGLSEQDVADLTADLDKIVVSVEALGFWRFGALS
jgi:hypothetical protein